MDGDAARVVITGMGALTPLGLDVATLWRNLVSGTSATRRVTRFDVTAFATQIGCEVDGFDAEQWMDRREARRFGRHTQLAVAAARQALNEAHLRADGELGDDIGVIVGTAFGAAESISETYTTLLERGPARVSPFAAVNILADMPGGQIAIEFGLRGPNHCVVSACATGNDTLGEAAEIVRRGDAVAMVAVAVETPIVPYLLAAFHRTGSLSRRNDDPAHASRPFDAQRDGMVFAEGAGAMVLERLDFARSRGATPLAEVVAYAATADAYHVTAPDAEGDGATRAMRRALRKASVAPEDVDYINAHGTSTPMNDRVETLAIRRVFGERAYTVPISSSKSMLGHLLGAAGVVEGIACVCTIRNGTIHPTINYETPDPACDLDYVPNVARRAEVRTVLSNSFGFGGRNATLVLRAFP